MKKNKKSLIPSVIIVILAVIAAVGSRSFLGPCVHEDGTFGVCHWAGQALFGLSLVLALEGVAAVLLKKPAVRKGLFLAMLPTGILGMLLPGTLISLCSMKTMRCQTIMRPSMLILFGVLSVIAIVGCLSAREDS